jgi:hypothetical protein
MLHTVYASEASMNLGTSITSSDEVRDLVREQQSAAEHGALDLMNRIALLGSYPARLWFSLTTPVRHHQRRPAEIHYLDHAADKASRRA